MGKWSEIRSVEAVGKWSWGGASPRAKQAGDPTPKGGAVVY